MNRKIRTSQAMTWILAALVIQYSLFVSSCDSNKANKENNYGEGSFPSYVSLKWKGGWSYDGEIWVFPDDTISLKQTIGDSEQMHSVYHGRKDNVFREIVSQVDAADAWDLTTSRIESELHGLMGGRGRGIFAVDAPVQTLEVVLPNRQLSVEFFGANLLAEKFPEAVNIAKCDELERAIYEHTGVLEKIVIP